MSEYASVSASAYDVSSLVGKLNEQAALGWEVVSIVPTGGDVTACLKRDGSANPAPSDGAELALDESVTEPSGWSSEPVATAEPERESEPEPPAEREPELEPAAIAPETISANDSSFIEATTETAPTTAATAVSVAATPAGWYPDPSGRYEMRYWDGDKWTEHVSRQGQTYTDPPVA